jgi:hypothetical protein
MKATLFMYRIVGDVEGEKYWIYKDGNRAILGKFDDVIYCAQNIPTYDSNLRMDIYERVNS